MEGTSGPAPPAKKARDKKTVPSSSKDDQRRHRALEKVFLKAQSQVRPEASTPPPHRAQSVTRSPAHMEDDHSRELSPDQPVPEGPALPPGREPLFQTMTEAEALQSSPPELATQAPPPQEAQLQLPEALETILARAIRQGLTQCLQQGALPTQPPPTPQSHHQASYREHSISEQELAGSPTSAEQDAMSEADEVRDETLSDDEGILPDQPPFIGLFRPQVFRSLLFKAIATTWLGKVPSSSATPSSLDPASAMFAEPTIHPETIPAPKLFIDVLHRQRSLPGAGPSPMAWTNVCIILRLSSLTSSSL